MKKIIPIGLLYSTTGYESVLDTDCLDGALLAIQEINASPNYDFIFKPIIRNPGKNLENYSRLAEDLITNHNCRQIFGTVISAARKEVIPVIEKYNTLLWYCCTYEGYESCENVIYLSATPNMHIVPLFEYIFPRYGTNGYIMGSNYIWGWVLGSTARELITTCSGEAMGGRFLPLGSLEVDHLIAEIEEKKPDFILNNMVGQSSYAFFRAYKDLGLRNPDFLPHNTPIVSCNVVDCEVHEIGHEELANHYTTGVFFDNQHEDQDQHIIDKVKSRFGNDRHCSAYLVANYTAITMLAEAISDTKTDDIVVVREYLYNRSFKTPLGTLRIDNWTNHATLWPRIGRYIPGSGFEIVSTTEDSMYADPYFVEFNPQNFISASKAQEAAPNNHIRIIK